MKEEEACSSLKEEYEEQLRDKTITKLILLNFSMEEEEIISFGEEDCELKGNMTGEKDGTRIKKKMKEEEGQTMFSLSSSILSMKDLTIEEDSSNENNKISPLFSISSSGKVILNNILVFHSSSSYRSQQDLSSSSLFIISSNRNVECTTVEWKSMKMNCPLFSLCSTTNEFKISSSSFNGISRLNSNNPLFLSSSSSSSSFSLENTNIEECRSGESVKGGGFTFFLFLN
jgi:hypothetical protein